LEHLSRRWGRNCKESKCSGKIARLSAQPNWIDQMKKTVCLTIASKALPSLVKYLFIYPHLALTFSRPHDSWYMKFERLGCWCKRSPVGKLQTQNEREKQRGHGNASNHARAGQRTAVNERNREQDT
jgi:hypothetical protein